MKRIRIHFYGLVYYYLFFFLLFLGFGTISLILVNSYLNFLLPILFIVLVLFSFILGVYEYNRISYMHTSLIINRKSFYYSSVIFGLINILISLGMFIGYAILLNELKQVEINFIYNIYFYLIFVSFTSFAYIIGNFYGLTFIKSKITNILIPLALVFLYIYFDVKITDVIAFTSKILLIKIDYLLFIGVGLIIMSIIVLKINHIIFMTRRN